MGDEAANGEAGGPRSLRATRYPLPERLAFPVGVAVSAVTHALVALFILFGGQIFSARSAYDGNVATVSLVSVDAFGALISAPPPGVDGGDSLAAVDPSLEAVDGPAAPEAFREAPASNPRPRAPGRPAVGEPPGWEPDPSQPLDDAPAAPARPRRSIQPLADPDPPEAAARPEESVDSEPAAIPPPLVPPPLAPVGPEAARDQVAADGTPEPAAPEAGAAGGEAGPEPAPLPPPDPAADGLDAVREAVAVDAAPEPSPPDAGATGGEAVLDPEPLPPPVPAADGAEAARESVAVDTTPEPPPPDAGATGGEAATPEPLPPPEAAAASAELARDTVAADGAPEPVAPVAAPPPTDSAPVGGDVAPPVEVAAGARGGPEDRGRPESVPLPDPPGSAPGEAAAPDEVALPFLATPSTQAEGPEVRDPEAVEVLVRPLPEATADSPAPARFELPDVAGHDGVALAALDPDLDAVLEPVPILPPEPGSARREVGAGPAPREPAAQGGQPVALPPPPAGEAPDAALTPAAAPPVPTEPVRQAALAPTLPDPDAVVRAREAEAAAEARAREAVAEADARARWSGIAPPAPRPGGGVPAASEAEGGSGLEFLGEALANLPQDGGPGVPLVARGPQLSRSEYDYLVGSISECWHPMSIVGQEGGPDLVVVLRVSLTLDGYVASEPVLVEPFLLPPGNNPHRVAFELARGAVMSCAPYDRLPREKYQRWREIEIAFNPEGMVAQ